MKLNDIAATLNKRVQPKQGEYTVNVQVTPHSDLLSGSSSIDVMVQVDAEGKITRLYTYTDVAQGLPKKYVGRVHAKNPTFTGLTALFLDDHEGQIEAYLEDSK